MYVHSQDMGVAHLQSMYSTTKMYTILIMQKSAIA
jgi:hypothetical protein